MRKHTQSQETVYVVVKQPNSYHRHNNICVSGSSECQVASHSVAVFTLTHIWRFPNRQLSYPSCPQKSLGILPGRTVPCGPDVSLHPTVLTSGFLFVFSFLFSFSPQQTSLHLLSLTATQPQREIHLKIWLKDRASSK